MPPLLHALDRRDAARHILDEAFPAGVELCGQRLRLRTIGRDVQRDRVLCVDEADLGIEETDLAALAFDRRLDGVAGEERVDDTDILLHVGELHRAQSHRAARREAGADAEIDPAGREAAQRREGVSGDGGDAVRRHEHASAEADFRRLHRRGRHRHKAIGGDHLRVVEPGMREAQFLGALRRLPGVARAGDADTEIHQSLPYGILRAMICASMQSAGASSPRRRFKRHHQR